MTHYRVRVRRGDFEVEVDSSDKDYAEAKLTELLAGSEAQQPEVRVAAGGPEAAAPPPSGKPLSLAEYVRRLSPRSGPQYVVALGSYLETHGGMGTGFKTRDIVDGFTAVKFKHSNPAEAVRQAKQQGLLMDGKEAGTLLVTATGEEWVKVQWGGDGTV